MTSLLDNNTVTMSLTHQAAADLARGTIPAIISPLEISSTLLSLEDKARQEGLSILLDHDRPMDYYAMLATVITNNAGDWTVISHLPLIGPTHRFSGYNYVNTLPTCQHWEDKHIIKKLQKEGSR